MKKTTHSRRLEHLLLAVIIISFAAVGFLVWQLKPFNKAPLYSAAIRLPVDIWPGNFWVLVADKLGYFHDEGLSAELVDISDSYTESMEVFSKGSMVDTYLMTFFDLVHLNLNGADLAAVFQSDVSSGGEGILVRDGVSKFLDLRGKKVGVENSSYLEYFLDTAMLANGIDSSEFTKVDMSTDDLGSAYESGAVDAIVIWEPDLSDIAKQSGGHIIFDTSKIKGFSTNIFAFRNDFLRSRPEDVKRLLRVWKKATDYILAHPDVTAEWVSNTFFKIKAPDFYSADEIKKLMERDQIMGFDDNLRAFHFSSGYDSIYGNAQYVLRYFQRIGAKVTSSYAYSLIDRRFIQALQ